MSVVTRIPESLDVRVHHVKGNGQTRVRGSIVRVRPRVEDGAQVDLNIHAPVNQGNADLHFLLTPDQVRDLIAMLRSALQLLGERDA